MPPLSPSVRHWEQEHQHVDAMQNNNLLFCIASTFCPISLRCLKHTQYYSRLHMLPSTRRPTCWKERCLVSTRDSEWPEWPWFHRSQLDPTPAGSHATAVTNTTRTTDSLHVGNALTYSLALWIWDSLWSRMIRPSRNPFNERDYGGKATRNIWRNKCASEKKSIIKFF